MIIKCKMCGGDILFNPGDTYGRCDSCDSVCTIPKVDDEGKLNRYNRANHFRRQCEFDKAVTAYEKILEQDETDAEAHWGAVISRFGIEYVEDPATGKRIPTCHRVQMTSILADADYKAAWQDYLALVSVYGKDFEESLGYARLDSPFKAGTLEAIVNGLKL